MWDGSYEGYPTGQIFGSVTCSVVQSVKEETRIRFSEQHIFDGGNVPDCYHAPGLCSVVNIESGVTSLGVVGALALDPDVSTLYRDNGTSLDIISTTYHSSLLNLTDPTCHTQYVTLAGATPSVIDVTIQAGSTVMNLSEIGVGYSDEYVMPYGLHIGEAVTGGAKHDNEVVTDFSDSVKLSPYDKIKKTSSTVDVTIAAGDNATWLIGRYAFLPLVCSDMTTSASIKLLPLFNAAPPDDWIAGFTFVNTSGSNQKVHMEAYMVAES